ncbi:DUF1330 domain-containing protein [Actinopolymorpha singaporensis]|uniref:Uncharacterized conserved protein, DUF1330 family n=1 Tax=Actinopolymorpha singaporensis TaxID=117157 RepID=A0A1H1NI58_9ACTN|nr:DUF1330 domain-containing protein [Actinopolymorpha singaporensis]SDR98520.1 Uncharacterized conserved protein, DUF1330 family [Actinopolymorpha singaporensis]
MPTYAIANLHDPKYHPDVTEYIERIQGTLDPFNGRFLVHGTQHEVVEGSWPGGVVVIEFPSLADAHGWYDSPAYQEILHLRTDHITGDVIFVEGVSEGYDPAKTAAAMRAANEGATGQE